MRPEERLRFVPGPNVDVFHVNSDELSSDIEFINSKGIENIDINYWNGYALSNVDWLSQIDRGIRRLVITPSDKGEFSFAGISSCASIGQLIVNNRKKDKIDLSGQSGLKQLVLPNCDYVSGLEKMVDLEVAILGNVPVEKLTHDLFSRLRSLKHLSISNSDLSSGLGFLKGSNIDRLDFFGCKKLSLNGMESLNLSTLSIDRCKNVEEINKIFGAESLEELRIIDSFLVDSPKQVCNLPVLKRLFLLGCSYFIDGDLAPLKFKLSVFSYDDKRHYNIKYKDFSDQFLIKN